jgi:anti-sigma factor RsiW
VALDVRVSLNRALKALHADRARIDKQIDAVTGALTALGGGAARAVKTVGRRGRRKMSAAQKKAVSVRMRAYWAKRRGSK